MLEFPELFGSPYILPAIIVVVILVLVLLFLMLRQRRRAPAVPVEAPGPKRQKDVERARPREPGILSAEGEPTVPSPAAQPAVSSPRSKRTLPSHSAKPLTRPIDDAARPQPVTDPLKQALERILEGWGDLTPEDLNRLKVFRKEKVLAAIAALEVPKELKGTRHAQSRLNQLRAYAASLREGSGTVPEEPTSAAERAGDSFWDETPRGRAPFEEGPEEPGPVEEAAAPEKTAEVLAPSSEGALAPGEPTTAVASVAAYSGTEGGRPEQPADESATEGALAEEVPVEEEPLEEVRAEELPVETPPVAEELPVEPVPVEEDLEKLALLEPEELAQVFERASDARTKMAIIDQLEHLASPAALDIIRRCLDDPDPAVQVHALEAADRLLGTGD